MKFTIVRETWSNIYKNRFGFLVGASVLHFFVSIIGVNILFWAFRLILITSDQSSLNKDNIYSFISNPITIIMIAIYILLVAFLTFIEFSCLISLVRSRQENTRFSIIENLKISIKRLKPLLGFQIIFFTLYFILMVPLENAGLSSTLTEKLYIPSFISEELFKTASGMLLYISVLAGLFYLNLRLIFTLPCLIIKGETFTKSIKDSWNITRKNKVRMVLNILMFLLSLGVVAVLLVTVVCIICNIIDKTGSNSLIQTVFYTFIDVVMFVFLVLSKISIVSILITYLDEASDYVMITEVKTPRMKTKLSSVLYTVLVLFLAGTVFMNGVRIYNSSSVRNDTMKIAHRGYTKDAVENTIDSLESAAKHHADAVELDIQLTKDNHFVVIHDFNLKRLTGDPRDVKDVTLNEIKSLTLKEDGRESKIPTLDDFIEKAKELDMNLFIELKPHGGEPDNYTDMFISKMKEHGVEKKFKAMSLDHNVMRKIKAQDPNIETGFLIPIQFGDFDNSDVDFYAVEDFSYNQNLADETHKKGRKIYVWTINSDQRIAHYLYSSVDGIISDNLKDIRKLESSLKNGDNYFDKLLRNFRFEM